MVALCNPVFKKKCSAPALVEGKVNKTSQSEPAEPMRPLPLGTWSSRTRWDTHTWALESDLGLSPSSAA